VQVVIRHATRIEDDYADIAPTVTALAATGDTKLVPRLEVAMTRLLDEAYSYRRDLIGGILAGAHGTVALLALLHASTRDLGDHQDALRTWPAGMPSRGSAASFPHCDISPRVIHTLSLRQPIVSARRRTA
jgi:hypothetical protein